MTTFKSMPTSAANQSLLENIAKVSKANNINPENTMKFMEQSFMQNLNNIKGVDVKSVQIEPKTGDLIVQVNDGGKLTTHRNPQTGNITPGQWLPMAWEQDGNKTNDDGEPIDKNGLTEAEAKACEVTSEDVSWCEIVFGRSFWGDPMLPNLKN